MIHQRDSNVKKGGKATQAVERKPYIRPQLIEYGHLEKMTQGASGWFVDSDFRRWGRRRS